MQKPVLLLSALDYTHLFEALTHVVSDEVYLINAQSLQFEYVSESVLKYTGQELAALQQQGLLAVLGVSEHMLKSYVEVHRELAQFSVLNQDISPIIPNVAHDQLFAKVLTLSVGEYVLVVRNRVLASQVNFSQLAHAAHAHVPNANAALVDAIVSNTPGLVFQLQRDAAGEAYFVYLSEGCKALLGFSAGELQLNSKLFYAMMNTRDRALFRKRLETSANKLSQLDWEGRVWINEWQDNKWINMRAIPRVLEDGTIQWVGIMINITQSKNEKHELEESRRALAELTAHMNQIKELERTRIAREIHDDLGGNLTAIKIGLTSMINRLANAQPVSAQQAKQLESIVDSTFEAVHRISSDLRPNILDLGIVAALEWQSKEFEKQLGVACQFNCHQKEVPVSSDQAIALFRICQESMSNIAKHAKATEVQVDIGVYGNEIVMTIADNGVGIHASDKLKVNSFGLRGMQERVIGLHGTFDIDQLGKQGTLMTIKLPIEPTGNLL